MNINLNSWRRHTNNHRGRTNRLQHQRYTPAAQRRRKHNIISIISPQRTTSLKHHLSLRAPTGKRIPHPNRTAHQTIRRICRTVLHEQKRRLGDIDLKYPEVPTRGEVARPWSDGECCGTDEGSDEV